MGKPKLSIIMVDGGFREQFHAIDFFCRQNFPSDEYELLWVEYYDKIHPELQAKIDHYPQARAIALEREGEYHSSYCFNEGILHAAGELLVIVDADLVAEDNFLSQLWQHYQGHKDTVSYVYRYNEPEDTHQDMVSLAHLQQVCVLTNPDNYGGCLVVSKPLIEAINGYDQHAVFGTGFHANGRDVYSRFKAYGASVRWLPDLRLYHPWHPDTEVAADSYIKQHQVIDYRARHLIHLPMQGLHAAPIPVLSRPLVKYRTMVKL
jgi:glycosyltransferase involved in cell wall biosynthesis